MNKEEAQARFREADRLFREGHFADALQVLEVLQRHYPDNAKILYPRARCMVALKRVDEAAQIYNQLVQLGHSRIEQLRQEIQAARQAEQEIASANQFQWEAPPSSPAYVVRSQRQGPNYLKWVLIIGGGVLGIVALGAFVIAMSSGEGASADPAAGQAAVENNLRILQIVLGIVFFVLMGVPLYLTLRLRGKLPYESVGPDYLSAFGFTFLLNVLSILVCIGTIIGFVIIWKRYEWDLVDLMLFIAISAAWLVLTFIVAFVLGLGTAALSV